MHRDILTRSNAKIPQKEISKWVATCWGRLSDVEKATFFCIAEEAKREYSMKHPNYKFTPMRQKQRKQDNWKAWRELLPDASSTLINFPHNSGNDSSHGEVLSGYKDPVNWECILGQLMCGDHVPPQPPLACFSMHGPIIHVSEADTSGSASPNQDQDQLSDEQMVLQVSPHLIKFPLTFSLCALQTISLAAADDGSSSATGSASSQSIWDELMDALQDTEPHPASVWSEGFFGGLPSASTYSGNTNLLPFDCYPGTPDSNILSPQIGAGTGSTQQTAPTSSVPTDQDFGTLFGLRQLTFDFDTIEAYFKTSEY